MANRTRRAGECATTCRGWRGTVPATTRLRRRDHMTNDVDGDQANRALVERFFAASEAGDRAVLAELIDDGMVMSWPQSGERFTGRGNVLAAMAAVEVKPQIGGSPRLVGSGPIWVLMVPLRYGEDVLEYVAVLELE